MWGIQGICTFSGKPIGKSISCLDFVVIAGGQPALECKWAGRQQLATCCLLMHFCLHHLFLDWFPSQLSAKLVSRGGCLDGLQKKKIAHLILLQVALKQDPLNCQKLLSASICRCRDPRDNEIKWSRVYVSLEIFGAMPRWHHLLVLTQYFSVRSIFKKLFSTR